MPFYEYQCPHGCVVTCRRSYTEREVPAVCEEHGASANVIFSPTAAIYIPIHFQQVREGGALGGGAISWSDVHEVSERELAHLKDDKGRAVHVERLDRSRSQGHRKQKEPKNGPTRYAGIEAGSEAAAGAPVR